MYHKLSFEQAKSKLTL